MMRPLIVSAALVAMTLAGAPLSVGAQSATAMLPAQCGARTRPAVPAEAKRRSAREMAARAQEAVITDDAARARSLYQQAAQLDPSDPSIAYALGRAYETAHDGRATEEYCRFLALAPNTPEAQDVRQRLAGYAARTFAATPPQRLAAVIPRATPSPGGAFATGIILPGGGQYVTHRPAAGLLVTAAVGGALFYALQSQMVHDSVAVRAIDPNGVPYQFYSPTSRTDRSHLAPGIAAAAGISLIAAIEAYSHARGERAAVRASAATSAPRLVPIVVGLERSVGVGARIALGGR